MVVSVTLPLPVQMGTKECWIEELFWVTLPWSAYLDLRLLRHVLVSVQLSHKKIVLSVYSKTNLSRQDKTCAELSAIDKGILVNAVQLH